MSLAVMTTGTVAFNLHPQWPGSNIGQNATKEQAHRCTNFRDTSGTPYRSLTYDPTSMTALT